MYAGETFHESNFLTTYRIKMSCSSIMSPSHLLLQPQTDGVSPSRKIDVVFSTDHKGTAQQHEAEASFPITVIPPDLCMPGLMCPP